MLITDCYQVDDNGFKGSLLAENTSAEDLLWSLYISHSDCVDVYQVDDRDSDPITIVVMRHGNGDVNLLYQISCRESD